MSLRVAFCSLLIVGSLVAGAAAVAEPAAAAGEFQVDHTLSASDAAGEIDVRTEVDVPEGTASMRITLPEGSHVREIDGFRRVDDRTYEWTRSTNEPFLRYDLEANATTDRGGGERHVYAVTDDWALVATPAVGLRWTGVDAGVSRSQSVDGDGIAGPHISFLGEYEEYEGSAADQRFRLIVPERADLREEPADVLGTYERAAERIDVGQRDPEVLVFVAPTGSVEWAATGVQRGDADLWVRDVEPVDDARNTWIHEYVHTRQDYEPTEETRWTTEGLADYYAAVVTYEDGGIDYEAFRERMERGTAPEYDDVVLSDPDTWRTNEGNYDKGSLVVGHLDRRLRAEADSSVDEVVESFNHPGEELTQSQFLDAVETAAGGDVRADAERYSETTATPEVWSREEHVGAYGGPVVRYGFDSFAVSGPYRQDSLDGVDLVAGETLTATVTARNEGSREVDYDADFLVDGSRVDSRSGALGAGERTTFDVSHEFDEPGEYDLRVGGASATAVVEEPGGVAVTDLEVEPTTAAMGETVTLRATVEPTDGRPGEGEVRFAADDEAVATETVRAADTAVVEVTTSFDAPGEYAVRAGDHEATVTVTDETVVPGADGSPSGHGDTGTTPAAADGGGFGSVAVFVVLLASVLAYRRR